MTSGTMLTNRVVFVEDLAWWYKQHLGI